MADKQLMWKSETYNIYMPPAPTCFTYMVPISKPGIACATCNVLHPLSTPATITEGNYLKIPIILDENELVTAANAIKLVQFAPWYTGVLSASHATTTGIATSEKEIEAYKKDLLAESQIRATIFSEKAKELFIEKCNENLGNTTVTLTKFCPPPNKTTIRYARIFYHLIKDVAGIQSGCFSIGQLTSGKIKIAFSGSEKSAKASIATTTDQVNTLATWSPVEVSTLAAVNEEWAKYVGEFESVSDPDEELQAKHCAESKLFSDLTLCYESVAVMWIGANPMKEAYAINSQRTKGHLMLPCDSCRGFLSHFLTHKGLHH